MHRGQFVPGGQRNDQVAMNDRQPASRDDQAAIRNAPEGRERALYLGRVANVGRAQGKTAIGSISLAKKIANATSGVNSISRLPLTARCKI
jgi:hypothetical protein